MELARINHGYKGSTVEVHRSRQESTPLAERKLKSRRKCVAVFAVIITVLLATGVVLAWFFWIHRADGSYSSWSQYGPCSKTCGGGTRNRTRECNDPSPRNGGKACSGPSTEIGVCGETPCPVNGSYSSWSQYGLCSKTCGGGTRNRTRECNSPTPKYGGAACIGPSTETSVCGNTICPGSSGITMTQQLVQDIIVNYQTTQNSTTKSTGRFQKAVFTMQREVANENAFEYFEPTTSRSKRSLDSSGPLYTSYTRRRTLAEKLGDMQKIIEIAVNGTDTEFARSIFAKSLFVYIKKVLEEGMPTSEIGRAAQGYLKLIEIAIGDYNFARLMSQNGAATLMFAIDTTGSMGGEINAAKAIATSIVNRDRTFPVDYILSPFNDPGTGPLTYKGETERQQFVSSISSLTASGGGDCPELAFKGMIDALKFQPQLGSPMFVFTDASAKDRTPSNIEELKLLASNVYATINFFVKNECTPGGNDPGFVEVASYTSGQIFPLQTDSEIEKFKDYVEDSLKDSVIIEEGKGGSSIYLTLDGEVTLLLISLELTQANQAQNVRLVDPYGQHYLPIISTTYSCIFKERYPIPGKWQLKCPLGVEAKAYTAKSAGNNTIDFTPYFLHSENETSPVLSVETPVKGKNTTTMLQVAGTDLLDTSSLSMDVVNETGSIIRNDIKVEPMENAKSIFRCTMRTPTSRFRIRLKGMMKNGHNFTRLSQVSFKESSIVLLTIRAGYEYTAAVGNITAPVYVYFYSKAETEVYNITASSTYGSMQLNPSSVRLMKGTNTTLSLQHHLPSNAQQLVGKVVTIKVGVSGSISLERKEHQIKMMYVR